MHYIYQIVFMVVLCGICVSSGVLLSTGVVLLPKQDAAKSNDKRPNIIFILTDDEDANLGMAQYMPNVQKYFIKGGTSFAQHYVNTPLCCPSRDRSLPISIYPQSQSYRNSTALWWISKMERKQL